MTPTTLLCFTVLGLLSVALMGESAFFRPVTRVVHYHSLPRYAYSRHVHVHEPLVRYFSHSAPVVTPLRYVDVHPHHHHHHDLHHHHHDVEEVVEEPHVHHSHPYYLWRRR